MKLLVLDLGGAVISRWRSRCTVWGFVFLNLKSVRPVNAPGATRLFTVDPCEITNNAIGPKSIEVVARPKRAYFFRHTRSGKSASNNQSIPIMSKKREMDENRTKYSLIRVKVERLQIGHICQFRRNIPSQQVATKSKYLHVLKRPKLSGD